MEDVFGEGLGVLCESSSRGLELSFEHEVDRLRIGDMLLLEDSLGERVFIIAIEHWHSFLHDDGPVVELFVHEVDRAAS